MKKIVVFLLLGFASFALIAGNSLHAEGEVVDLYPYNQQACLEAEAECTQLKVGSDNWNFTFGGYRYHAIRGSVRYVSDFSDANDDGEFDMTEITGIQYQSFGSPIINNTDETVVLAVDATDKDRTDLYNARHDVYMHFDENGILQMFEATVETFYIHNDGTTEAPEWRLATQAEIDAYNAASAPETETPNTIPSNIRMKLDATDSKGYVIERLGFTQLLKPGINVAEDPVSSWSDIIDGNPVDLTIPAGWTVLSFAFLDRTSNPLNLEFIKLAPELMLDETVAPMVAEYVYQEATFTGITELDDDAATPGVNIVVEYNGTFDLDSTITASWLKMFDESNVIVNVEEKLDYSVTISQDGVDLETINFVYDEGTDAYTASAAVTVIDSSNFGADYLATWTTTTPENDVTEQVAQIVVGVIPPKFVGVEDRFINQSTFVELLEDITAVDGEGTDITDSIVVEYPSNLNTYSPMPGQYTIGLFIEVDIFIPGVDSLLTFDEADYVINAINPEDATNANSYNIHLYEGSHPFKGANATETAAVMSWTSEWIVLAADGTVKEKLSRGNNKLTNELNPLPTNDAGNTNVVDQGAWLHNLVLAEDEVLVVVRGSSSVPFNAIAKGLAFGDSISYTYGVEDFSATIERETEYILTVDDTTAPILMVVNPNYSFYAGEYTSVNAAILANVVAYDFTDAQDDLVKYVSNNGGLDVNTPGTYTVEVTVEDAAGHTDVQSFDVIVKEALLTEADIEALIEDNTLSTADIQALIDAEVLTEADIVTLIEANVLSEADVQALIDADLITEAQIQALIDASLPEPETGCGSAITGTSAIFITFSLVLGVAGIFFFRRRR